MARLRPPTSAATGARSRGWQPLLRRRAHLAASFVVVALAPVAVAAASALDEDDLAPVPPRRAYGFLFGNDGPSALSPATGGVQPSPGGGAQPLGPQVTVPTWGMQGELAGDEGGQPRGEGGSPAPTPPLLPPGGPVIHPGVIWNPEPVKPHHAIDGGKSVCFRNRTTQRACERDRDDGAEYKFSLHGHKEVSGCRLCQCCRMGEESALGDLMDDKIEEKEEVHFPAVDVAIAVMLLGGVGFVLIIFNTVNSLDDDIRRYSWTIISSTISIFTAVLMFSAVRDVMFENLENILAYNGLMEKAVLSLMLFLILYIGLQGCIAFITGAIGDSEEVDFSATSWVIADTMRHDYGEPVQDCHRIIRQNKGQKGVAHIEGREIFVKRLCVERERRVVSMKCFATLLAHMSGFALISLGGTVQEMHCFNTSPAMAFVPIVIITILMVLLFQAAKKFRHHLSALDNVHDERDELYDEEVTECEHDIAGLALSFLFTQVLRFSITGTLPSMHGLEKFSVVSYLSAFLLYLASFAFAGAAVLCITMHQRVHKTAPHMVQKLLHIFRTTFAMCFGWCFLWATRWFAMQLDFLANIDAVPGTMGGRLFITLAVTFFAAGMVYGLDHIRDSVGEEHIGEFIEVIVTAVSVLVGFSWESAFEMAEEAAASRTSAPLTMRLIFAASVSLVILPGWRMYILTKVLALNAAHEEKRRAQGLSAVPAYETELSEEEEEQYGSARQEETSMLTMKDAVAKVKAQQRGEEEEPTREMEEVEEEAEALEEEPEVADAGRKEAQDDEARQREEWPQQREDSKASIRKAEAAAFEEKEHRARMLKQEPRTDCVHFNDPRLLYSSKLISVVAFSGFDEDEPVDAMCSASILSNFYELEPEEAIIMEPPHGEEAGGPESACFCSAAAAFQALRFWKRARDFELLTAKEACRKAQILNMEGDPTFAGYGGEWMAMLAVLTAKFVDRERCSRALLATGDSYLIDCRPASASSLDCLQEEGVMDINRLGLQLMAIRDWISGNYAWTKYVEELVDIERGVPTSSAAKARWRSTVSDAITAVTEELNKG